MEVPCGTGKKLWREYKKLKGIENFVGYVKAIEIGKMGDYDTIELARQITLVHLPKQ